MPIEYAEVDWVGVNEAVSVVELPQVIDWSGPALIAAVCPSKLYVIVSVSKLIIANLARRPIARLRVNSNFFIGGGLNFNTKVRKKTETYK